MFEIGIRHLATIVAPVVGAAGVLAWRVQETRRPVSTRSIILPPLGMSTGFGMFALPAMRVPLSWAAGALLLGALVFSWPLLRSSHLQRTGDVVTLQRSKAFLVILVALAAVRLILHDYLDRLVSPQQTAALLFLLAFGMIVRWRVGMLLEYRRLTR